MKKELVTLQIHITITERRECDRKINWHRSIATDDAIFIPPDEFKKALLAAGKYAALRTA